MNRIINNSPLCLITIFLFILFLRLPSAPIPFFNIDEGTHAVVADTILDGGIIYRDAMHTPGPITPYTYALIFLIFGRNNMAAIHFALIFLIFATAVVLYLIGRLVADRKTGCWAALFFSVFSYTYENTDMLAFHTEWAVIFFTSLGAYFFLKYIFKIKYLFLLLGGFFFGLAFFSKQPAILDHLVTLAFLVIFEYSRRKTKSSLIKPVFALAAGFLLVAAAFVLYFYINHALRDFWFFFWEVGSKYYVPVVPLSERIGRALFNPLQAGSFLQVNYLLVVCFIATVFITIFRLFGLPARHGRLPLFLDSYLISWGIFSYLGANYSGRQFGHYFILILPAFCIVSAKMVQGLFNSTELRLNIKILLAATVISSLLYPLAAYTWRIKIWRIYPARNIKINFIPVELSTLVDYIKNNSRGNEKIFVWGNVPEIYVLSGRRPASRHIWCNLLTDLIPGAKDALSVSAADSVVPEYWRIFIGELEKNRPKFIIDASFGVIGGVKKYPPEKFREFHNFLSRNYLIRKEFFANGHPSFRLYEKID